MIKKTAEQINVELLYKALEYRIESAKLSGLYNTDYVAGLNFALRLMSEVFFPEVVETIKEK